MHGDRPLSSIGIRAELAAAGDVDKQKRLIGKWLDKDRDTAHAFWQHVRVCGGLAIGDWKFVADPAQATAVLQNDAAFTVSEYNERMRVTSGRFYLGMDGAEHEADAKLGEVIPSWNTWNPIRPADLHALEEVRELASAATRVVLTALARRTELARLTHPEAECQLRTAELLGPVLDACAAHVFGVPGHSAFSLITWARDITAFYFRVHADKEVDLSAAKRASAQYRQHVLALIAALDAGDGDGTPALRKSVDTLRRLLGPHVQDEDVARNLIGILTGSLTATSKALIEALLLQPHQPGCERFAWPELAPARTAAVSGCPYAHAAQPSFPHYDAVVAAPLAKAQRGSLDMIYRKYAASVPTHLGSLSIAPRDLVIVWLGGTLAEKTEDNLFGIGVHKCPGMDMGKAILDGVMRVLTQLRGADAPRRRAVEGDLALVFENVEALKHC